MRVAIIATLGVLGAAVAVPAVAAEVSEKGAAELQERFTHYLPEDVAKSGFLTVTPATRRYEVVADFSKLLDGKTSPDFSITGLKPVSMFAEPLDDDQWKMESTGALDIAGKYTVADIANAFSYAIGNYTFSGIFDTAISYYRSGELKASNISVSSDSGTQSARVGFSDLVHTFSATDSANGQIDIHASGGINGFSEEVTTPQSPPFTFKAEKIVFDTTTTGLMMAELRDFVFFVLDHAKQKDLDAAQQAELKAKFKAALPIATNFVETIAINNVLVGSPTGDVGIDSLAYDAKMTGLTESSGMNFAIRAGGVHVPETMLPAALQPLVPKLADVEMAIKSLNLSGALTAFLDKADFSAPKPLSDEDSAAIGRMVFPDESVYVNIDKIALSSDVYDLEMSGVIKALTSNAKKASIKAVILARDLDKTIDFFKKAGKHNPQFSQVSFGLMMGKGMAKTDPDGRSRWDLDVGEDGSVAINGQQLKGPN